MKYDLVFYHWHTFQYLIQYLYKFLLSGFLLWISTQSSLNKGNELNF